MLTVKPFKGILYNLEKVEDLGLVISPPYDVIDENEYNGFLEKHPYNVVRLDGCMPFGKNSGNGHHQKAADSFREWLEKDVLIEEEEPAFYVSAVDFDIEGKTFTRYGLVCLVELERYDEGSVLPHEKTFSKTKDDRLDLMKACQSNFSQIFALYNDDGDILDRIIGLASKGPAEVEFKDTDGHKHKMWRITDPEVHRELCEKLAYKKLVIADGHHRYESALAYRDWVAKNDPDYGSDHPANYVMTYLCSAKDPGLIILPTHRILSHVDEDRRKKLMKRAEEYFYVTPITWQKEEYDLAREEFLSTLSANSSDCTIGVLITGMPEFYLLTLKPNILEYQFKEEIPDPLKELDASVLSRLIFRELLNLDRSDLDQEGLVTYSHSEEEAIDEVFDKKAEMAFILNPPTNAEVIKVAEEGFVMPRKSTFYYPKVITGQVMNSLSPRAGN